VATEWQRVIQPSPSSPFADTNKTFAHGPSDPTQTSTALIPTHQKRKGCDIPNRYSPAAILECQEERLGGLHDEHSEDFRIVVVGL
jgi:hypothetical protein